MRGSKRSSSPRRAGRSARASRQRCAMSRPRRPAPIPNWVMGRKISVDSATMMNKALEVIEARYLFGLPPERLEVVIHPQSVIHSMVQYRDTSVVAQLGTPDMRVPIAYGLAWPDRVASGAQALDFHDAGRHDFRIAGQPRPPRALPGPGARLGAPARAAGHHGRAERRQRGGAWRPFWIAASASTRSMQVNVETLEAVTALQARIAGRFAGPGRPFRARPRAGPSAGWAI